MAALDGTHVWIGAETGILKGEQNVVSFSKCTEMISMLRLNKLVWFNHGSVV